MKGEVREGGGSGLSPRGEGGGREETRARALLSWGVGGTHE